MDAQNEARLRLCAGLMFGVVVLSVPAVAQTRPQTSRPPAASASGNPPNSQRPRVAAASELTALLEAANAAHEQGRSEQSLNLYNRVIALSAGAPQTAALANLRVGNIYLEQRKFDNALNSFKQATLLDPNSADAHNNLGEALGELKQYKPAIESFNRAVALDPKLLKARYNLAISYSRMGSQKYAEFVFRNLIKSNPNYSLAYDGLAVTLSRAGRAKEALPFHERAIELSPADPYYRYNLALSYLTLGDTAKAVEQQQLLSSIDTSVADQLASVIVKRKL